MKTNLVASLKLSLKQFCNQTSIQGWKQYIRSLKQNSKLEIVLWPLLYMTFSFICLRDFSINLTKYLEYNVSTRISYVQNSQLNFPAITLCNVNMFRRRAVATSEQFMVLSSMVSHMEGVSDYRKKLELNIKHCKAKNDSKIVPELVNIVKLYEERGLDGILQLVGMNSANTIEGCWFQDNEIDCNKILIDHLTDRLSLCFTINPDQGSSGNRAIKDMFGGSVANDKNTANEKHVLYTNASGPTHSIRLLINVDQNDYCGLYADSYRQRLGAGYISFIHDHNIMVKCTEKLNTYFHPGKSYSIALKATNVMRNTEALGKCRSHWKSENNRITVEGPHVGELCLGFCFMRHIYVQCQCLFKLDYATDRLNQLIDVNGSAKLCGLDDKLCADNAYSEFAKIGGPHKLCPDCMYQPCTETVYTYRITEGLFPAKKELRSYINASRGIHNENDVRKNYLFLSFYFDSMSSEVIVENQMFNTIDLMNASGTYICLFLGMSFLSVIEIDVLIMKIVMLLLNCGRIILLNILCDRPSRVKKFTLKKMK